MINEAYLPVRCLFRVDKCEASILSVVSDRLVSLGAVDVGAWNVVLQIFASDTRSSATKQAAGQRYICVRDDTLDVPLLMHVATHLPLLGQDALLAMLQVTVKQELSIRGKRFRFVDEDEMDWEVGLGCGPPQPGAKNTLFVSMQMIATRSRLAASLNLFVSAFAKVVGEELAQQASHFHHQQPAGISQLVASNTYNRSHLTLQYVTMFQSDIQQKTEPK